MRLTDPMMMYWSKFRLFVPALIAAVALGDSTQATHSLTVEEARQLALQFNRTYLQAREAVNVADANVMIARAGAFPEINVGGAYTRNFNIPSFFVQVENDEGETETLEFQTGFKNSFGANLSIVQSIWQGGKVFTAWSIARDFRKYSLAVEERAAAGVLYNSDVLFFSALLQRARLEVLRKSYEAASHSLDVVEKQRDQGVVSEFEVLRARVEKSNLEPQILEAESDLRLADQRLKSFLGIPLEDTVLLIEEPLSATIEGLPSPDQLVTTALDKRPEMREAEYTRDMRRKAIRIARADYWPSLSAVAGYDWQAQSDQYTLKENVSRAFTAGLRLNIPIFQGGRTRGAVTQAIAEHNQALLEVQQTRDDIRLEVEQAYDRLLQARQSLETHQNTIALAEEGLRIANLRYESGVGTLLEVLSAQAALTQAREILAQATFAFRAAKAGLKLATTIDVDRL
ncbi:MAG: TolC family protein [Candidatus Zixiibacteriota bacterium]